MQIHSSYTVIIGLVTTVLAAKKMHLLVTIGLFGMTTLRTGLACVSRVNLYYKLVML